MKLTEAEILRYSRHIILPEVGGRGQKRILNASVLLAGLGAAGSAAALYLAAAGVGRITLWDPAPVTEADLASGIAHTRERLGQSRAGSAAEAVGAINPAAEVQVVATAADAVAQVGPDQLVLLSTAPWQALHDTAVARGARVIACGVHGAAGAVTVFQKGGPCLACLPREPLQAAGLYGEEEGETALAAAAGVVGIAAATEAVKLILGVGRPLAGRLLAYDGWCAALREEPLQGAPGCPVCGA